MEFCDWLRDLWLLSLLAIQLAKSKVKDSNFYGLIGKNKYNASKIAII